MNDLENLLREGMERFTSDLRAPAGLTRRVTQRRRRRLTLRSLAGAGAAACAATVVAVVLPAASTGTGGSFALAASAVRRVDSALGTADMAQMTITIHGPIARSCSGSICRVLPGTQTATAEEWSYRDQWRSITYVGGHPIYDESTTASSVYTLVSYLTRTWTRGRESGFGGVSAAGPTVGVCGPFAAADTLLFQPGLPGIDFSASSPPASMAAALRAAVSCGTLTEAGRQRVDGIDAIKLTSGPNSLIRETIWVSPGTYLPVRVDVDTGFHVLTANITWLEPTAQNLAKLTVPVPAGFRRTPLPEALGLLMLGIHGGQMAGLCLVAPAGHACVRAPSPAAVNRPGQQ